MAFDCSDDIAAGWVQCRAVKWAGRGIVILPWLSLTFLVGLMAHWPLTVTAVLLVTIGAAWLLRDVPIEWEALSERSDEELNTEIITSLGLILAFLGLAMLSFGVNWALIAFSLGAGTTAVVLGMLYTAPAAFVMKTRKKQTPTKIYTTWELKARG